MARVLVVDDDPDIRFLIAQSLARGHHAVTEAADGVAGLAAARADVPDVILLDWMMPGLSGIDVCAALRAEPRFDTTSIILVTARAQRADVSAGEAAGADDYIRKPFSPRDLRARVEALAGASPNSKRRTAGRRVAHVPLVRPVAAGWSCVATVPAR